MAKRFEKGDRVVVNGALAEVVFFLPSFDAGDGTMMPEGYRVRYCGWGGEYANVPASAVRGVK